jgi:anaerobic magnesium-protoporphyrin IX monomethyl ester cyclase
MTSVLLIYPYFKPRRDRSVFRFPPLGVGYIAASLLSSGHEVRLIDCTFLTRKQAMHQALEAQAEVVGIYCMVTMLEDCFWFARGLRSHCRLLIAGGPLPSCDPDPFLEAFDVVVRGEGEETMDELLQAYSRAEDLRKVKGIVRRSGATHGKEDIVFTPERPLIRDLDHIPFPARELLPNEDYIRYGKRKYGYAVTTVLSTRGCPFRCEFCSNVVYGGSYRERSPANVVDEIERVLKLGYERVSFADDVFTLKRSHLLGICDEIERRGLHFQWECLGRVDAMDEATAQRMKAAGCTRIYFGIESGNEAILKLMDKKITLEEARLAAEAAHRAGLEVGAFFILFYPGDTQETVLETLRFAGSLPLDYLGLTMPYPLPGTALLERVMDRHPRSWRADEVQGHALIFDADFSETKMRYGILKGRLQFEIRRRLGRLAPAALWLFEGPSEAVFRLLR